MSTTNILYRIRELANEGQQSAESCEQRGCIGWEKEQFGAILHNVKRLEDSMTDTDTTEEAQWWTVTHDSSGWHRSPSIGRSSFVSQWKGAEDIVWESMARVCCRESRAEQAAVDAWREAGFTHTPKAAPGPKRVEVTWWGVLHRSQPLASARSISFYSAKDTAELNRPSSWADRDHHRIVKVEAVISEVKEGEPS